MKRAEYLEHAQEAYDSGQVSEEVYDAMLLNADYFCDDGEDDNTGSEEIFGVSDYVILKETGELMLIIDMDESGCSVKNKDGNILKVEVEELEKTEAEYEIPITWEMYGKVRISAKSAEEALNKVEKDLDHIKLPSNGEYVEASMEIAAQEIDNLHLYQEFGI